MRIKKTICVFILISYSIIFAQFAIGYQTDEIKFSLNLQNQPLKSVLKDIERMTGFTFIVDEGIASTPISGIFNNVTLYDFCSRALKNENIAVLTDNEQKCITISNLQSAGNIETRVLTTSANFEKESDNFVISEADYINHAKRTTKKTTPEDLQKLKTDRLTGKTWLEVEQQMRSSDKNKIKKIQISEDDFLASESDYIKKAKMAVKNKPKKNIEVKQIDPLTGKSWNEIESQM